MDREGNLGTGAVELGPFTIDTTAPSAPSITTGPSGDVTDTAASFTFTGEAGATFSCALDGATALPCSSPQAYAGLAVGAHAFQVRAVDAAGNASAAADATWRVVAPTVPAPPKDGKAPQLTVTAPAVTTFAVAQRAGFTLAIRCDEPATARGKLVLSAKDAKALGLPRKAVTVATFTGVKLKPSSQKLVVKLTRTGQQALRKLKHGRRLNLALELTAVDATGNAATVKRAVVIRGGK